MENMLIIRFLPLGSGSGSVVVAVVVAGESWMQWNAAIA